MELWTQSPRPMQSMLGKLLAMSVMSVYWTGNVTHLLVIFSRSIPHSPLYAIHFRCCFTHLLKIALYQSWLYCEMMFAVAKRNSGRDENRRPFNCDLTLGYTSKSNGARYGEYWRWSTLPNPRTSSFNSVDAVVWGGELSWWRR